MIARLSLAALGLSFCLPALAGAQETDAPPVTPGPPAIGETITIGGGVGMTADYTGSNEYQIIPALALRGTYKGVRFASRGTYLTADLMPKAEGKLQFNLGPIAGVRLNRVSRPKDEIVKLLPKRKAAIELGGFAGVSLSGLTNPFDSLSFRVDALHDINGAHGSTVISPSVSFGTPLSFKTYVSLSASADYVQDDYARTYFSIDADDAAASGLPVFDAKGGMQGWKVSLLANQAISGNLLGGWSLFGLASYGKLRGDFADSPIVSLRGSPKQGMGAIGLAYTF